MTKIFRYPWVGPMVAIVLLYGLFAITSAETFGRPEVIVEMARQTVVVAITAIGMTLVIIHGGIDLSVGSAVALTSVVIASLLKSGQGPFVAVAGGVACSAACGLVVGGLVTGLRMAPFIVTLGAMTILRGVAKGLAGGEKIDAEAAGLEALTMPGPVFAPSVWLTLVVALVVAALLRYTRTGRHIFAVGSNEHAARLSGVVVPRVKIVVYTLAGLLSGIAGLVVFSNETVGDPTGSEGLELSAIASVVIGGGSLSGGEGSVAGSLVGAFLLTVIKAGCTHVGLPNWVQHIVTGVIIIVAVALDRLRHRKG